MFVTRTRSRAFTITALRLGNFKAFGATQRVPIRPLTLIFGPNSAGKSSIIHSLLLAQHALETGQLDVTRTQLSGDSVDLGGYVQYLFKHDQSKHLELGFELDPQKLELGIENGSLPSKLEVLLGIWSTPAGDSDQGRGAHPEQGDGGPQVGLVEFVADGVTVLRMSRRPEGTFRIDQLDYENPFLKAAIESNISRVARRTFQFEQGDPRWHQAFIAVASVLISVVSETFLPSRAEMSTRKGVREALSEALESTGTAAAPDKKSLNLGTEKIERYGRLLAAALTEFLGTISRGVERGLGVMRYLGPLRTFPPRDIPDTDGEAEDPNWVSGGASGWDVVRRDWDVRADVNNWLGSAERLQTPYELSIRRYADVESDALLRALRPGLGLALREFGDRLIKWVEENDGQSVAEYLERSDVLVESTDELMSQDGIVPPDPNSFDLNASDDELLAAPYLEKLAFPVEFLDDEDCVRDQLILVDKRTGVEVSHRDIGIGVSQVLPVLAMAYGVSDGLIAIEQPEIHLHPGLQAELADVFLQTALTPGRNMNTFLIETHSEHLILRVMRRMRETHAGTLPAGVPPVRPEDVAVLYVEPGKDGSVIRELPLNERGELVKPWPGGFFEEGLRETLA